MVFRLDSQVLEYRVGPEPLHLIPILDLAMPNWVVNAISGTVRSCKCFVTYEEIQVLCSSLHRQISLACAAC